MNESEQRWLQFTYAWNWFEYHASQRLIAFRFYLIIIGAVGWIFLRGDLSSIGILHGRFFGAALSVVSLFFYLLEKRNNKLVNCGRFALDRLEKDMSFLDTPYAIRQNDKNSKRCCASHYFVIRAIYFIVGSVGLVLIGMSFRP